MKINPGSFYDEDYFYPNFKMWTDEFGVERKYYGPSRDWGGFIEIANWINANIGGKSLLDVGCSAGGFVSKIAKLGYQCSGVDISRYAISHPVEGAEGILNLRDITTKNATDKYDVVTSMDLLEHIYADKIDKVIQYMIDSLNNNGYMFSCICTARTENDLFVHSSPDIEIPPDKRWLGVAGHVNVQKMPYWIEKLERAGFKTQYELMCKFQIWRLLTEGMKNLDSWSILNIYVGKKS